VNNFTLIIDPVFVLQF